MMIFQFNMSRIVTFTPRFVLKNNMTRDLQFCLKDGNTYSVGANDIAPINIVNKTSEALLAIRQPGVFDTW